MAFAELREGRGLDRITAGDLTEQQHPDPVEIGRRCRRPATQHLGGHREWRAHRVLTAVGRDPESCAAEIHQHDTTAALAHDVRTLHVPVHDAGRVDGRQRLAEIDAHQRGLAPGAGAEAIEKVLERGAVEQLGPHAHPSIVHVGAMHEEHVGVPHSGERACLLEQLLDETGAERGLPELERHLATQPRIEGAMDLAVGAGADPLAQQQIPPGACAVLVGARRRARRAATVDPRHLLDQPQRLERLGVGARRRELVRPRHRRAIRDRVHHALEPGLRLVFGLAHDPLTRRSRRAMLWTARRTSIRAASEEGRPSASAISR